MRSAVLLGTLGLALVSGACASTTGAVPRPFPVPRGVHGASSGSQSPDAPDSEAPGVTPPSTDSSSPPGAASRTTGAGRTVDLYAITSTALALRGRPYRDGGADPNGFDCSGFTQYVFGQHGLTLPRGVRDQFKQGNAVKPERLLAGDLIFFTTVTPGASHVGIALGGDEFIHAPSGAGVVRVERLSAPYWSQRLVGARRLN